MKTMKAKCARCGEIIEVSRPREYKSCKCGAISLDFGDEYYSRMGGAPEDFDKEFDKENGIERFKSFSDIKVGGNDTEFITLTPKDEMPKIEIENMGSLVNKVWDWFDEHDLHDPVMQLNKVIEEVGELAHEITRGHRQSPEIEDALGDVLVTVIGMCHHLNYEPAHALGVAYNEIKNRKGKVVEGSFVKETDGRDS